MGSLTLTKYDYWLTNKIVFPVMLETGFKDNGLVSDVIVTLIGVLAVTLLKPLINVRGTVIVYELSL